MGLRTVLALTVVAIFFVTTMLTAEARYLPTRSQEDRLDRLRDLLRDLLESEELPLNAEKRGFFKREMPRELSSLEQLYRQN